MLIALYLLNLTANAISEPNDAFHLWSADPMVKIFPDTEPSNDGIIEISCARNEYQSAQFVISPKQKLEGVTVEISEISNSSGYSIPPENITWNFVGYVSLAKNTYHTSEKKLLRKAPAEFPDPLLNNKTINIEAKNQPVWLIVHVPEDAPAGIYTGEVTVHTNRGSKSLPIVLNVYPFVLPTKKSLFVTFWFDHHIIARVHGAELYSERYWDILWKYAVDMARHGQNVVETPFPAPIELKEDGSLKIDYASMDKWVEFFQRAGACDRIEFPAIAHTAPGESYWKARELFINDITAVDQNGNLVKLPPDKGMAQLLRDLDRHLQERGWSDKAMIHISDEPTIYKLESYCKIANFIHENAPHIKIIEAIETTGFGKCLDVWVPKLSHLANWFDEYQEQRTPETEIWFYTCCHPYGSYPNRFIDFPLIETRLLFWLNWKYRLKGYLHWGLNRWTADPFKDIGDDLPPGDRYIIYPGDDGPMSSIRWEATREGIQDYEYFRLLSEKTKQVKDSFGKVADFINEDQSSDEFCRAMIQSFTEYDTDPMKLRKIRKEMAEVILSIGKSPLILVKTTPQAETKLFTGPVLVLIRGVVESGATVRIQGKEVKVKPDGTFAEHAFVDRHSQDIIIECELNGNKKSIVKHFSVQG